MSKKVLIVINSTPFLISHRLEVCCALIESGYELHVAAPDSRYKSQLERLGAQFHDISLSRNSVNFLSDVCYIFALIQIMMRVKPDLVHLITIKPLLYGGIICKALRIKACISSVAGLGYLFSSSLWRHKLLRLCLIPALRLAFSNSNQMIIFQNQNDMGYFGRLKIGHAAKKVLIFGSGVDLTKFKLRPEPAGKVVITYAGRLLVDKGILVLVDAIRHLRARGVEAEFWLLGEVEAADPRAVDKCSLSEWEHEGLIKAKGFRKNIADLFGRSHLVVFPSFYGEGVPKVLIEAAACGRACVTTDHPGCRDAILPSITGLLARPGDSLSLANALQILIRDKETRQRLGAAARKHAEEHFSVGKVVMRHMMIYEELLGCNEI